MRDHECLNLFALDAFENITLKIARTAKKAIFGKSKRYAILDLQFHQMQRANKIGQLKQSIFSRAHILNKIGRAHV